MVGRIQDSYTNRGVSTEKVFYCFYKIVLKNMGELKTSQPCLHTHILTPTRARGVAQCTIGVVLGLPSATTL